MVMGDALAVALLKQRQFFISPRISPGFIPVVRWGAASDAGCGPDAYQLGKFQSSLTKPKFEKAIFENDRANVWGARWW